MSNFILHKCVLFYMLWQKISTPTSSFDLFDLMIIVLVVFQRSRWTASRTRWATRCVACWRRWDCVTRTTCRPNVVARVPTTHASRQPIASLISDDASAALSSRGKMWAWFCVLLPPFCDTVLKKILNTRHIHVRFLIIISQLQHRFVEEDSKECCKKELRWFLTRLALSAVKLVMHYLKTRRPLRVVGCDSLSLWNAVPLVVAVCNWTDEMFHSPSQSLKQH